MGYVMGKNFMLYMEKTNASNQLISLPVCYAQDVQLSIESDLLEVSISPDSQFRNYVPGMRGYSVNANGLVFDGDDDTVNIADMQRMISEGRTVKWQAQDISNPLTVYSGSLLLKTVNMATPYDNVSTFEMEALGTGAYQIKRVIPGDYGLIYSGIQDDGTTPTDFGNWITGDPSQDIIIRYGATDGPKFFWVAYSKDAATKKNIWQDLNDTTNSSTIGTETDLFDVREVDINGHTFYLHMTAYPTQFTYNRNDVAFKLVDTGVLPPRNFTVVYAFTTVTNGKPNYRLRWDPSLTTGVDGYVVRIINVTDGTTQFNNIDLFSYSIYMSFGGFIMQLEKQKTYMFSVKATAGADGSEWVPDITINTP